MRSRAFRPIAAMLTALLLPGVPVQAGPVAISEVIQVLGSYQNPPDLRLRSLNQTQSTPISDGSTVNAGNQQAGNDGRGTIIVATTTGPADGSLLAGVAVSSYDPQRGVEIIDQGNVEGTICDCGEILIPGGGFPKWPLLFLAAIPFFFINGGDDDEVPSFNPTPTPPPGATATPTPPETPIPEPASLLLFGSGLAAFGAGLRRRYAKSKLATQVDAAKEA